MDDDLDRREMIFVVESKRSRRTLCRIHISDSPIVLSSLDAAPFSLGHQPYSIHTATYYHISHQLMMKKQDEGLEMLGQSAERLSQISMGIHEELGHQNK
jgi:hypothetical protein